MCAAGREPARMSPPDLVEQLRARLQDGMDADDYAAWLGAAAYTFKPEAGELWVQAPTVFIKGYLEKHYGDQLAREAESLAGRPVKLRYQVNPNANRAAPTPPMPPEAIFRAALGEPQPDFFIPDLAEVALKDDVHLMELAPFTLQPRGETRKELSYTTAAGMEIRITAHPDHGLPTSNDYNIVLMMESYLANLANHYRRELERYEVDKKAGKNPKTPVKPPRYFEPTLSEIMSFTRTGRGGIQQERIVPGLQRLQHTACTIRMVGRRKTRTGSFNFINAWEVVTENATSNVSQVRIHIPEWIYDGIVEAASPTILTYDRDYLLLNDPFMMVFYRFMRLKVEPGKVYTFTAADLHARSNSRASLKEFNRELRAKVKKTGGRLLGYQLRLVGTRDSLAVEACFESDASKLLAAPADLPAPDDDQLPLDV